MRVLIHEYFTGGGLAESPVLPSLLSEAYAMLSTLLKDFSYNAGCEVIVTLDSRLAEMVKPLAAGSVVRVSKSRDLDTVIRSILSQVDATLIVAPETDGVLPKTTEIVEDEGNTVLLGSSSAALKLVSNKDRTMELARSLGAAVPRTISTSADEGDAALNVIARDIGFPVVIKPQDGAGCEGIFVAHNQRELQEAAKKASRGLAKRRLLIQEYIGGTDASVSTISSRSGKAMPLSLNRQLVNLRSPDNNHSTYEGGYTPFDHPLRSEAYACARRIVEAVKGLRGYVGIDFVLTEEKPVFMEVNARITTSYAGLSRVLLTDRRKGVASAIIDAAEHGRLPSSIEYGGVAYYSKSRLKSDLRVDSNMINVLCNLEYVESPPFKNQEEHNEVFLVSTGQSLTDARDSKSRNEKMLQKITAKLEIQ